MKNSGIRYFEIMESELDVGIAIIQATLNIPVTLAGLPLAVAAEAGPDDTAAAVSILSPSSFLTSLESPMNSKSSVIHLSARIIFQLNKLH